jgi:hypothetical protein
MVSSVKRELLDQIFRKYYTYYNRSYYTFSKEHKEEPFSIRQRRASVSQDEVVLNLLLGKYRTNPL